MDVAKQLETRPAGGACEAVTMTATSLEAVTFIGNFFLPSILNVGRFLHFWQLLMAVYQTVKSASAADHQSDTCKAVASLEP